MKKTCISASFALGSAFALSLAALPATAIAATTATLQPVAMMGSNAKNEGNCSQMMGKGHQEGNCSKNMGTSNMAKTGPSAKKAQEGHCVSSAAIKAHDGKCGKKYMGGAQ